jgi:hypothetical protein
MIPPAPTLIRQRSAGDVHQWHEAGRLLSRGAFPEVECLAGGRETAEYRDVYIALEILEEEVEAARHQGMDEALPEAYAACEALVAAGLLALAEKEDEKAREKEAHIAYGEVSPVAYRLATAHRTRAACLREMSLAVSLGQFRTAECNEAAIVKAHRDAAGFNPSKAGGEARAKKLSPAKRKKIATNAARARWAKKGE